MSPSLSNKKKSRKLLSIIQSYEPQKNGQDFVRNYSQLLSKHFSQTSKQKTSLRKSLSSSNGFRQSKSIKLIKPRQNHQHGPNQIHKDTKNENESKQVQQFFTKNQTLHESAIQKSLNPQMLGSQLSRQKNIELNPQTNLKLEKILKTKTQFLEKNSHENVLLNQKLHQSTHQKKALMNLIENLRLEILKEKKTKAKISTNIGKLMNKIEQANTGISKTEEERFYIKEETQLMKKELNIETKRNNELKAFSSINQQNIKIEKEFISNINIQMEKMKAEFLETKNHLTEIKEIYMRKAKCLLKVEMHKNQSLQEMNVLCKTVEQSVTNLKKNYNS